MIVIDTKKSVGDVFVLLEVKARYKWSDGEQTKEVEGSTATVLSLLDYERYNVKLPTPSEQIDLEKGEEVEFIGLQAVVYVRNNRPALSLRADRMDAREVELFGKK